MTKAIFLDRDGVLNRATIIKGIPHPPSDISELEILPGVPQALAKLKAAGFRLIVVSNQPDVARGTQSLKTVEAINDVLKEQLAIDEIRICYHDDADHCECRKPLPGMLVEAAKDTQINLTESYMVGDRWRDIEAGKNAGCRTILIDYGYGEGLQSQPDVKVESFGDAVKWILHNEGEKIE